MFGDSFFSVEKPSLWPATVSSHSDVQGLSHASGSPSRVQYGNRRSQSWKPWKPPTESNASSLPDIFIGGAQDPPSQVDGRYMRGAPHRADSGQKSPTKDPAVARRRRQRGKRVGSSKQLSVSTRSRKVVQLRGQQFLRNTFCLFCGRGPFPFDCGCRWIDPYECLQRQIEHLRRQLSSMSFAVRKKEGGEVVASIKAMEKQQEQADRSPQHVEGCLKHDHALGYRTCHGRCIRCRGCTMGSEACDHFNPSGGPTHPTPDNRASIPDCQCHLLRVARTVSRIGSSCSRGGPAEVHASTRKLPRSEGPGGDAAGRGPGPGSKTCRQARNSTRHARRHGTKHVGGLQSPIVASAASAIAASPSSRKCGPSKPW